MISKKPTVKLTGADGNAFNILGLCHKAYQAAKTTPDFEYLVFRKEATSGNYDHLLQTAMKYFDVK